MGNPKPTKNPAVLNEESMKVVLALALLVVGGVIGYFTSSYINAEDKETIAKREYDLAVAYWTNGYKKIGIEPALSNNLLEILKELSQLHSSELQLNPNSLRASDGTLVANMVAPKVPPIKNNGLSFNCCEPLEIEGIYKYTLTDKTLTVYDKRYCSVLKNKRFLSLSSVILDPDRKSDIAKVICVDEVLYDAEKVPTANVEPIP